jgi:hypothetical protein
MAGEREDDGVARAWGGRVVPGVLAALATVYFVGVWTEAREAGTAARWFPAPVAYFMQIAALYAGATHHATDYRAEGFRCRDRVWSEIDPSPWFPVDADNKENRFYRAIHFYGDHHPHRPTLRALDEFIVSHYDGDALDAAAAGRSSDPIGGVRFVRVSVPVGDPGDGSPRYERKPLDAYPADQRKDLYYTPESKRHERCAQLGMALR